MNNILILIVNFCDYKMTETCVNQLIKINVKADILVIDNKSPNSSYEYLTQKYQKFENVKVIQSEKNGGYSYGNNFGIRSVDNDKYDFYCIMNPDVILEFDYLNEICDKINLYDDVASISTLMFLNGNFQSDVVTWKIPTGKEIYKEHFLLNRKKVNNCVCKQFKDNLVEADVLPGSFFVIKKNCFNKIHLFDENVFLYNEENIIGLKLRNANLKQLIDTSHYYIHNHKATDKKTMIKNYKFNFKNILFNYKTGYKSRKYLCSAYLNNKYHIRLSFVNLLNLLILHFKHFISYFYHF